MLVFADHASRMLLLATTLFNPTEALKDRISAAMRSNDKEFLKTLSDSGKAFAQLSLNISKGMVSLEKEFEKFKKLESATGEVARTPTTDARNFKAAYMTKEFVKGEFNREPDIYEMYVLSWYNRIIN